MYKISVAMATYNGENYIKEQLESLLNQKRQPDEVIICDDGSTDSTIEIINSFINYNNLFDKWKLIKNKHNKGYTKNFLDCASKTSGDIIFFCDQDDIWDSDKINKMVYEFKQNSNIKALSCTLSVINDKNKPKNTILNKIRMGSGNLKKITFPEQVKKNLSIGLTLSITRETLRFVKPIILKYDLPFDVPIGLFMSVEDGYYVLEEPLVYRRVHSDNVSQPKYTLKSRLNNLDKHIKGREKKIDLLKICLNEMGSKLSKEDKSQLLKTIKSLKEDICNIRESNILPLIKDLFSNNPMKNKLVSLTNLLCVLFGDYSKIS